LKLVILDEGVPWGISRALSGHDVTTVQLAGWESIKNGKLLVLIEKAGLNVFITGDKNMRHQKDGLDSRPFAVLLLSTIHWPSVKPHVAKIAAAVDECRPGELTEIECGRFEATKVRRPKP
jgi:hypothetical protein